MNHTPPPMPDAAKVKELLAGASGVHPLKVRFNALLDQATGPLGLSAGSERFDAKAKCRSMFDSVLEAGETAAKFINGPAATGTDADLRRIAEGGLAHQVREVAKVVFRDTPGVDAHALEHGDPCLWVGAMAATIVELRARVVRVENLNVRLTPLSVRWEPTAPGHVVEVK